MFCSNLTLCFHESPLSPSVSRWSAGPNLVMVYLCVFSSSRVQEWYSLRSSLQWQHVSSFWLWYLVCTVYIVPPFYLIRSGTPSEQLISSRHLLAFPGFTARLRVACLKSVITCTVVGQGQTCRMGRSEPDPNPGILKIEVYTHILYVYIYEVDNGWSNVDDFIFYFFFLFFLCICFHVYVWWEMCCFFHHILCLWFIGNLRNSMLFSYYYFFRFYGYLLVCSRCCCSACTGSWEVLPISQVWSSQTQSESTK